MIINGQSVPEDRLVKTDVCVVGTGMGGSSLLHELLRLPLSVTVIEAGDRKISSTPEAEMVGRPFDMPRTRSVQLGGTMNLWHGVCSPLDAADFQARPWIPHSGWPITLAELAPYYTRACALLRTPLQDYFEVSQLPESIQDKISEIPISEILHTKIFQVLAAPRGLAENMDALLSQTAHVQCFTNSAALELRTNESDRNVEELIVATKSGRTLRVQARCFVLCAGGLETPRLLLNSNRRNPCGVGNEHDVVGRFLGDHPAGNLCQIEFRVPRHAHLYSDMRIGDGLIRSGLVFSDEVQHCHRLPNHMFFLRPAFKKGVHDDTQRIKNAVLRIAAGRPSVTDLWLVLKNLNVVAKLVRYKRSLNVRYRYADVYFQTEQVPNPESRVMLSDKCDQFGYPQAKINWSPCHQDYESMKTSFQIVRQALKTSLLGVVHYIEDVDWNARMTSAAHHLGTARMGGTTAEAVVDNNLRVFSKDNLFICDASVFPTAGNANPSLTICALALRLADHLKEAISPRFTPAACLEASAFGRA